MKVFVGMGGNFVLAAPDTELHRRRRCARCALTVHVSTKLNRSHLVHGEKALILPCLGRTEKDHQRRGIQATSVEDSMSMVHLSVGMKKPASPHLLSEPAIIAGIARATLPQSGTPWEAYVEDYDRIRDTMAEVLDGFEDFNRRVRLPLGFRIRQPARELVFLTPSGRAEFSTAALPDDAAIRRRTRSADHAQPRPVEHHDLLRQRPLPRDPESTHADPDEPGRHARPRISPTADWSTSPRTAKDGSQRSLKQYRAIEYDMPRGCAAGYMPEMNVLVAASDYSSQSNQPLMKNIRVHVAPSAAE